MIKIKLPRFPRMLVTSRNDRRAEEQGFIFIEVLPRELVDVVSEPVKQLAHGCGLENEACGFKTLNDAVVYAERVALALAHYVKPEDLLFFFSERLEALQLVCANYTRDASPSPFLPNRHDDVGREEDGRQKKNNADPRAVILCKLEKAESFQELLAAKKQGAGNGGKHCEITWIEFQELRDRLEDSEEHAGESDRDLAANASTGGAA